MKTSPDTDITPRARALYREYGPHVDTATAARLRAARRNALDTARTSHRTLRWMLPAGAFAVAVLALAVNWTSLSPGHMPEPSHTLTSTEQALPPDADQTDPALYQDMDFYAWLAEQPQVAGRTAHP